MKKYFSTRTQSRKKGFTLIELLVVIAIISILASILFPVFARARENARRASCQSNLKQIALGIIMYTQDYDSRMPMKQLSYPTLAPVLASRANPYGWADAMQSYVKSRQIFQCPSESNGPNQTYFINDGITPLPYAKGYTDYYMNSAVLGPSYPPNTPGLSDAEFVAPSQTVLLGDGVSGNSDSSYDGCVYSYDDQSVADTGTACTVAAPITDMVGGAGRHLDGANYAFVDGHVKWLKGSIISGTVINGSSTIGNRLLTIANANGEATFSPY